MMKTNRRLSWLGALVLLGLLAPRAGAQTMTYQGRLKESGVPVSGNRNVDVLLCNCLSGACVPACSSSGSQGVAVSNGLFRTTFTIPVGVDMAASQTWYLEVRVEGTPLLPREELTAVPYAVFAATAAGLAAFDGASGVLVSTPVFFSQPVTVGMSGSPVGALLVRSTSATSENPVFTAQNLAGNSILRVLQDGRAIIGQGTPGTENLQVTTFGGASARLATSAGDGNTVRMRLTGGAVVNADWSLLTNNASIGGTSDNLVFYNEGNGQARLALTPSGGLGLGTKFPAALLHASSGAVIIDGTGAALKVPEVRALDTPGASLTVRATDNSDGGGAGGLTLQAGTATSGNNSGGPVSLTAGESSGSGPGGNVVITAGSQGGGTGGGGAVTISAGGGGGQTNGGAVTINGGTSPGALNSGGAVTLAAGSGTVNAGAVVLRPGSRTGGGENGVVIIDGATAGAAHLRATQPSAPGVGDNGNCGTVTGSSVFGTDMAGRINFPITGGVPGGCAITVNFLRPYASAPGMVLLTPANFITASLATPIGAYVDHTATSVNGFTIRMVNNPQTQTYSWFYMVIE